MHCALVADRPDPGDAASRLRAACEVALVFLVLFIQGAWPAPHVNEPHYLGKARHYWDATWCPDDFFCNTADAHQVFYWTIGWLSRLTSLATMAWCGRVLTWALLAWAWRRLSWSLVPGRWYAVLSAALLVTLVDHCQMAGEWIIGGVEAKGFAYVLVLLGLEALVRGRWSGSVLLFGAACAFHVIVGGWAVVGWGVTWLASSDRPPIARLVLPVAGGLLLALPGLLPALALTSGVDPATVAEANKIYVYERLGHHLLPQRFATWFVVGDWAVTVTVRHLLLIGALAAVVWWARPAGDRFGRLNRFVAAAVGIAAVGMAIALFVPVAPELAAGLLRFYWFRMSDVMVPLGVALVVTSVLFRWQSARPASHPAALVGLLLLVGAHLSHTIWQRGQHAVPPADANVADLDDWRETCAWIATHTPPEGVFLTPRLDQTFRWYASRAQVVSRKDIPQDAPGIVEWWRRNDDLYRADAPAESARWHRSLAELGAARLTMLGHRYGADYVVTAAQPPVALERIGPQNSSYAIYRLPSPSAPDGIEGGDPTAVERR